MKCQRERCYTLELDMGLEKKRDTLKRDMDYQRKIYSIKEEVIQLQMWHIASKKENGKEKDRNGTSKEPDFENQNCNEASKRGKQH